VNFKVAIVNVIIHVTGGWRLTFGTVIIVFKISFLSTCGEQLGI
jgi:hypothetical protein